MNGDTVAGAHIYLNDLHPVSNQSIQDPWNLYCEVDNDTDSDREWVLNYASREISQWIVRPFSEEGLQLWGCTAA